MGVVTRLCAHLRLRPTHEGCRFALIAVSKWPPHGNHSSPSPPGAPAPPGSRPHLMMMMMQQKSIQPYAPPCPVALSHLRSSPFPFLRVAVGVSLHLPPLPLQRSDPSGLVWRWRRLRLCRRSDSRQQGWWIHRAVLFDAAVGGRSRAVRHSCRDPWARGPGES